MLAQEKRYLKKKEFGNSISFLSFSNILEISLDEMILYTNWTLEVQYVCSSSLNKYRSTNNRCYKYLGTLEYYYILGYFFLTDVLW